MEKEKRITSKGSFVKGAAWIAVGGFLAKLIGAFYRIPLTNAIGGHGMGLYQMVYPVYCLLLTVSATGIPSSIAKLTAERAGRGESDISLLKASLKLFLIVGAFGTLLMCALAPFLSRAQGVEEALGGYYALAPSVFLTSGISVFRGWFQGRNKMHPTAISEVAEQLVKVGFGLFFACRFRENVALAVVFLLLSVSISELATLFLMLLFYRGEKEKSKGKEGGRVALKEILRLSIPVTFNAILLPVSSLLDSVLAPRLLGKYAADGVALYGLFAGGAVTVVNLPVSICYGIAAASIPAVATAAASGKRSPRGRIFFALFLTLLASVPAGAGLYFFARPIVTTIFRSLTGAELATLVGLVKTLAISAVTLSLVQTLSACLTAQGKPQYAALSMLFAVIVKTAGYLFWLKRSEISVYGLAYATNLCYLVAFLLDFLYNMVVATRKGAQQRKE